jgi:hypothetical protein
MGIICGVHLLGASPESHPSHYQSVNVPGLCSQGLVVPLSCIPRAFCEGQADIQLISFGCDILQLRHLLIYKRETSRDEEPPMTGIILIFKCVHVALHTREVPALWSLAVIITLCCTHGRSVCVILCVQLTYTQYWINTPHWTHYGIY